MHVETLALSDEPTLRQVRTLVASADDHDEHFPLSDAKWLQLSRRREAQFTGLVVRDGEAVVGYAHLAATSGRRRDLEVVVAPDSRDDGRVADALVGRAIELVEASGGGEVHLWWRSPTSEDEYRIVAHGFAPGERLLQLRRPLPDHLPEPVLPAGTTIRSFRPGVDEDAWLEVNHRAFADHPDQGRWTREELQARMSESWFDARGFLVAQDAQGMAGFCWTKVHARPRLGEIYVIAADPSRQGLGLGRALVLAGLHSLAGQGLDTGMLYTDAANEAGVHLYKSLGFDVHHEHRTFVREVAAG